MKIFCLSLLLLANGCAWSNHGVFPKPVWYWSADAQQQREHDNYVKKHQKENKL